MAEDSDIHDVTVRRVKTDSPMAIKCYGLPENMVYEDIQVTDGEIFVNTKE